MLQDTYDEYFSCMCSNVYRVMFIPCSVRIVSHLGPTIPLGHMQVQFVNRNPSFSHLGVVLGSQPAANDPNTNTSKSNLQLL